IDVVLRVDSPTLSSAAVIGIVIGSVVLLLLIADLLCCAFGNLGILATLCRKTKRSPSDLDDEAKLGSGSLIKERPPSPLPLPPPIVKLGATTPLNYYSYYYYSTSRVLLARHDPMRDGRCTAIILTGVVVSQEPGRGG
uniref:Uncharacterized protein n=1 Tax=Anopheles quadriannulatus TaxID=34691 RepID=A0A182XHR9_ANOQN